jgi:putative transcriptional regulator
VATPGVHSAEFDRTVILLLEHGDHGALGVVLNRPSALGVGEPLPRWAPYAADPPMVFVGGPVSPSSAICLARALPSEGIGEWQPLFDGLGTLDLGGEPDEATALTLRVFAGYAGWGPGQLESEIEAGAWYVFDSEPGDALCDEPHDLWSSVLRRQGGHYVLVASFPPDPTLN